MFFIFFIFLLICFFFFLQFLNFLKMNYSFRLLFDWWKITLNVRPRSHSISGYRLIVIVEAINWSILYVKYISSFFFSQLLCVAFIRLCLISAIREICQMEFIFFKVPTSALQYIVSTLSLLTLFYIPQKPLMYVESNAYSEISVFSVIILLKKIEIVFPLHSLLFMNELILSQICFRMSNMFFFFFSFLFNGTKSQLFHFWVTTNEQS